MSLVTRPGDTEEMILEAIDYAEKHRWYSFKPIRAALEPPTFYTDEDILQLKPEDYKLVPQHSIYRVYRLQVALKIIRNQKQQIHAKQ